ncbi:MAG: hypothetical protein ABSF77_09765 [Spirochaetia bacterium]
MKTQFFSDFAGAFSRQSGFKARRVRNIEIQPLADLRRSLASLSDMPLVYVDLRGLSDRERKRIMTIISAHPEVRFGVFDPGGSIKDTAGVFHAGAVDYLGKGMSVSALTAKRRAAVLAYARRGGIEQQAPALPNSASDARPGPAPAAQPAQADGWAEVVPGREHRFSFLLVEVDDSEELKKRHEPDNLAAAMETFRGFIESIVTQHGGRLWMWSRFGGLILFPLNDERFLAPVCGLRILLSSIFYDVEESLLPGRLSFRMALSLGATVYHEHDTGRIVSDAINSIFHLGQRFTPPGQFLLTAEAYDLVPPALREFFLPSGTFEGRRILRMLRPSSSLGALQNGGACGT